jgi:ribosome-associated translation inhibitor RaiA
MFSGVNVPIADYQRWYAEYRFFRAIARHEPLIRIVHVAIRRDASANGSFGCTVTIGLTTSETVKTQARAAHPAAEIDRAAERMASLLERRVAPAGTIST